MSPPSRQRLAFAVLMLAPTLSLPHTLHGQSADATVFRSGQWSTEFSLSPDATGVGVLRFSSPVRAWIGSVQLRRDNEVFRPNTTLDFIRPNSEIGEVAVQLGHRWYRPVADRVQQHATVGALASGFRRRTEGDNIADTRVGAGLFADLGALWMVTQRLSLGAAWTVQATRERSTSGAGAPANESSVATTSTLSWGQVRVLGAVYF